MFNVSYVVVTVKARLEGMDPHIEEAAMDLGANEWTTFRKVTLPLIAPGIAAAGLLAFALSFDDFVITNFNAGQTLDVPAVHLGRGAQGVPPQVNVLATALLLVVLVLMALNVACSGAAPAPTPAWRPSRRAPPCSPAWRSDLPARGAAGRALPLGGASPSSRTARRRIATTGGRSRSGAPRGPGLPPSGSRSRASGSRT